MTGNASGPASQVKTVSARSSPGGNTRSTPSKGPPPPTALNASAITESCAVKSLLRSRNSTSPATVKTTICTIMPGRRLVDARAAPDQYSSRQCAIAARLASIATGDRSSGGRVTIGWIDVAPGGWLRTNPT
ncbi:MAG: hypothetical protein DMF84_13725 [Acidobacteria bacterium]|nr:MAG: hypothetical protein DMF84_13725 [Acidobacteriota bacterium]